jgi:hypothetical protein
MARVVQLTYRDNRRRLANITDYPAFSGDGDLASHPADVEGDLERRCGPSVQVDRQAPDFEVLGGHLQHIRTRRRLAHRESAVGGRPRHLDGRTLYGAQDELGASDHAAGLVGHSATEFDGLRLRERRGGHQDAADDENGPKERSWVGHGALVLAMSA